MNDTGKFAVEQAREQFGAATAVDVLAVMDAAIARLSADAEHYRIDPETQDLREARAAVAELVEAARPLTNALHDAGLLADLTRGLRAHEIKSYTAQLVALEAALAKFGGAA